MRHVYTTIRDQRRPVRFVLSRLLRVLGISPLFRIRRPGYVLYFHPSSLSQRMWAEPASARGMVRLLNTLLEPGGTFVDVGANIGAYTVAGALAVGTQGRIYAFEPHPRIARHLRENLRLNNVHNVRVGQTAVGDRNGWIGLSDYRADNVNRVSNLDDSLIVPQIRLSDFVPDGPISLIKIDVEGAEKAVLNGASEVLEQTQMIIFEASDRNLELFQSSFQEIHDLLTGHGFAIFDYVNGVLQEVPRDAPFPNYRDLLAVRDRDELARRISRISGTAGR